jgi:hypothetical protein
VGSSDVSVGAGAGPGWSWDDIFKLMDSGCRGKSWWDESEL